MSGRKKINKFKVSIVIFIVVMFLMTVTGFGRFVYNTVKDRYLSSKKFYFTSDVLTTNLNDVVSYNNWDGNGIYEIEINLFSQNNDLEQYEENLDYSVLVTYDNTDIICALDSNNFDETQNTIAKTGTILVSNHKDTIKLYVKPNMDEGKEKVLDVNSEYEIEFKAYTNSPYRKTLGAKLKLKIAKVSYKITENNNYSPYVILNVRNVYDYESDVTIGFNNSSLLNFDLNDSIYIENKDIPDRVTTDENGNVTSITFSMPAESSRDIKFYKKQDHNYTVNANVFVIDRVKK